MKSCPQCNQNYNDETLNFCLNDGAMLVQSSVQNQPAETVMMNNPRVTANQTPVFTNQPQTSSANVQPRKKSKTWMWVLGIFAVLIGLGAVGIIGLAALISQIPEENDNNNRNVKRDGTTLVDKKKTPETSSTDSSGDVLKDDLSDWHYNDAKVGTAYADGNEMIMTSKASNFYFMLSTPDADFRTENALTKVTVKNVDAKASVLGFGLLINCDESTPGKADYFFLIDSKSRKYRIGKHSLTKETNIIDWTSSSSINTDTEYNELEVKDDNGSMNFFINGQSVKTIKDTENNKSGIVGLYVGGGIPIAFSDLEIRK